jgi:hypothetical protein
MLRPRAAASAVFLFLVVRASGAAAYCRLTTCEKAIEDCRLNENRCVRDGVNLVWNASPIVYRFQEDGSDKLDTKAARAAIRRAFDTWANAECKGGRTSLRFEEGPEIQANKRVGKKEAEEPFGIYFRDNTWPYKGAEDSLAFTYQNFGKDTGVIQYADIEINTTAAKFSLTDDEEGIDLQAVLTHEVGHYIGLAHSNDKKSIMVPSYCASDDRCQGRGVDKVRALAADDIKAVCTLYPPPQPTEPPAAAAACSAAAVPGSSWMAVLVLGGALARRRLRRQSCLR